LHSQAFRTCANRSPKSFMPGLSIAGIAHSPSNALPIYTTPASIYMNRCSRLNCPDSPLNPRTPTKYQSGLRNGSLSRHNIQKLADTCSNSSSKSPSEYSLSFNYSQNLSRLLLCNTGKWKLCLSNSSASSKWRTFKQ
jgi:hypothetical protein